MAVESVVSVCSTPFIVRSRVDSSSVLRSDAPCSGLRAMAERSTATAVLPAEPHRIPPEFEVRSARFTYLRCDGHLRSGGAGPRKNPA